MAEVVLADVCKVYPGNVLAVDHCTLTIADGEFVVLVGPSGCGKSTTLRMVAGLEEISSGTIRIGPRVVNDLPPKDRDIAMVFQNYALYPHMTVYQNMAFALKLRRKYGLWDNLLARVLAPGKYAAARQERAQIDQRVHSAADMLGITPLLARKPRALSGGQRQRVAVGRAIVREPKAFLFDEPLSNLDAKLRIEMRAELKRLHRQVRTTTIYVTHDQEEAMTLGDRVVVMKDGVVHQTGTPFDVYDAPVNRFVAAFVGTPPMNFFSGRLVRGNGALTFDNGHMKLAVPEARAQRLAAHAGQPVVLGVRPEMLTPTDAPRAGASLRARVSVVEPLGDRMDVFFDVAGQTHLVCRTGARAKVREAADACFDVDMSRAHFFEPSERGRNLLVHDGEAAPGGNPR